MSMQQQYSQDDQAPPNNGRATVTHMYSQSEATAYSSVLKLTTKRKREREREREKERENRHRDCGLDDLSNCEATDDQWYLLDA